MKKLITIFTVFGLTVLTNSVSYALPSDNFNDNLMDTSLWSLYQPSSNVWLNETTQRLEVRSTADEEGAAAVYLANGWGFSTAEDFSFRADFHVSSLSAPGDYEFGTMLGLGKGGGDFLTLYNNNAGIGAGYYVGEAGYEPYKEARFDFNKTSKGIHGAENHRPRILDDGIFYISYNAGTDELYMSNADYGASKAMVIFPGLLKGEWDSDVVIPFLGGSYIRNIALSSGDAYLDNFVVDSGKVGPVTAIPAPGAILLGGIGVGLVGWMKRRKVL
jgi:hypothetical protein